MAKIGTVSPPPLVPRKSLPSDAPSRRAQPSVGALLYHDGTRAPSSVRFMRGDTARDAAGELARSVGGPVAQAVVVAGVEALADRANFLLDGAEPVSMLAALGFRLYQMDEKLDRVLVGIDRIERELKAVRDQLERIEARVNRTHAAVLEQDLREDVRALLRDHTEGDTLNLRPFCADLAGSFARFEVALDEGRLRLGGSSNLALSQTTRKELKRVLRLLLGLRHSTYAASNAAAGGAPLSVVGADPVADYWPHPGVSTAVFVARRRVGALLRQAREDAAGHGGNPLNLAMDSSRAWEHVDRTYARPARGAFEHVDADAVRLEEAFRDALAGEDPRSWIEAFRPWWLYETDAGLLWRLRREAEGVTEGYAPFPGAKRLPSGPGPTLLLASADAVPEPLPG